MRVLPAVQRRADKFGCTIHGHVMRFGTEEVTMFPNDPIYESAIVRYYTCINCPHTAEEVSLTLKDEFIAE
jgi:hypothetical protein